MNLLLADPLEMLYTLGPASLDRPPSCAVRGPASQAELGRATGIDRSDVTGALAELEARHLVDRKVDPQHKRCNVVTITGEGVDTLVRLDAVLDEIQAAVLAPLSSAERDQLLDLLTRVV